MSKRNSNSILVVDDDSFVLESVSRMLSVYGYPVVPCSNGEDAITQLFNNDTGLILSDIKMPGI